ncbi:MAG: hypothetical protein Fur0044_17240 [Anaerolineae bacterium]
MPNFNKLHLTLIPVVSTALILVVLFTLLPQAAGAASPDSEGDLQLSATGASFPQIAANGTFAAIVYARSGQVFLRATQGSQGWWSAAVSVGSGATPRLAFTPNLTNEVHIVWASAAGDKIYHRRFTLAAKTGSGGTQHEVQSGSSLETPDVAVDSGSRIHVAWSTQSGTIVTRVSTDSGASWSGAGTFSSTPSLAHQPVLAVSDGFAHLAVTEIDSGQLGYYRSALGSSHSWFKLFTQSPEGNFADIRNPAIAATDSRVYLAWDSVNASQNNQFGLIGALSDSNSGDEGGSWPSDTAKHITSNADYSIGGNEKISKARSTVPISEGGLRPSLAITGANFAVVWQQRPNLNCQPDEGGGPPLENGTAEVNYAATATTWSQTETLGNDITTYAIAPDLAFNTAGRHIVFLKATGVNCSGGGGSLGYAVYYRGPLTTVQPPEVYLPVVVKN